MSVQGHLHKPYTRLSWWLGWIGTGPYLVAFGLIVLLFDPILRLTHLVVGYRGHQAGIRLMNWCLYQSLWLNGCRISWNVHPESVLASTAQTKLQSIPSNSRMREQHHGSTHNRVCIFVANHQSLNDIPPLIWKLGRFAPVLVSKAELSHGIPSISYNFKVGGVIAIQRQNPTLALQSMASLGQRIAQSRENVLYFPEGTRARNGLSAQFKSGGLEQMMRHLSNFEIVPIAIQHSWKLAQWNFMPIPFGQCLRFDILPSIPSSATDGSGVHLEARSLMQAAQNAIQQHILNQNPL